MCLTNTINKIIMKATIPVLRFWYANVSVISDKYFSFIVLYMTQINEGFPQAHTRSNSWKCKVCLICMCVCISTI